MPKNRDQNDKAAVAYLAALIKPHRKYFFAASLTALLSAGTGLLNAKVTQLLIDSTAAGERAAILRYVLCLAAVIAASTALGYANSLFVSRLSSNAARDMKRRTAERLLRADYGALSREKAGDLLSTVNADAQTVTSFLADDLVRLLSQAALLFGALVFIIGINPLLALVTFAYTPLGMFFTMKLNAKMNRLYPIRADKTGEALASAEQVLMQLPVIKSFLMEREVAKRLGGCFEAVYQAEMKLAPLEALLQPACQSVSSVPRVLFLIVAGRMVMNGTLTLGALIAVFDLLVFIIGPTVYFPFTLNGLNKAAAAIGRLRRVEALPAAPKQHQPPFGVTPGVTLSAVNFGYTDGRTVLKDVSFSRSGPGIVAVKGKSGAGKTTLLDLIAGLYQPGGGAISVSGAVSALTQETYLFSETILDNIRRGRPDAPEADVVSAAHKAGLQSLVEKLPGRPAAIVGDGAGALSGGERQRIGLARVLLSDAPIWLLDEPTSALDEETEQTILDVLRQNRGEKLIFIAAHRPSLLALADVVIDLDIKEAGTCVRQGS